MAHRNIASIFRYFHQFTTWVSWKRYIIFELFQLGGYCTLRAPLSSSPASILCAKVGKYSPKRNSVGKWQIVKLGPVVQETIDREALLYLYVKRISYSSRKVIIPIINNRHEILYVLKLRLIKTELIWILQKFTLNGCCICKI